MLLDAGATTDALELAVATWRDRRCAPYADLVDTIAAKLPRRARVPRPRAELVSTRGARRVDDPWSAAAKAATAAELGPLLAVLDRVPETGRAYLDPVLRRHAAWLARIDALAARPADPRIATALVRALRDARLTVIEAAEARAIYAPALALIAELADERAIATLQDLLDHPVAKRASARELLAAAIPDTLALLSPSPPLLGDDAARCAALRGSPPEPVTATPRAIDDSALVDQVVANLADDGPRSVLADHWIERGDPRGELIAQQLRGTKPSQGLIRKVDVTLGDLARVSKNRIYARGFLDELELHNNAAADPRVWAAAAAAPQLATVQRIIKGQANETLYRSFIISPQARSLARVVCVSKAMLAELCARTAPTAIRELQLTHAVDAGTLRLIATSAALPRLADMVFVVSAPGLAKLFPRRRAWCKTSVQPSGHVRVHLVGNIPALLRDHLA